MFCQKQPKAAVVPGVFTANELESGRRLDLKKSAELCLPATLVPQPLRQAQRPGRVGTTAGISARRREALTLPRRTP